MGSMSSNNITATTYEITEHAHRRGAAWRKGSPYLYLLPAIAYLTVTLLYPIYSNMRMSLHDVNVSTFLSGNQAWVGLANYRTLFDDPAFWNAVQLSITFTAGSILFQFTIGLALALLFNSPFPGNNILRSLMLLGWLMPTILSGSVFRWMLDGDSGIINYVLTSVGLLDEKQYWLIDPGTALAGTIIANIWVGIPFNMLLLLAGLQAIPTTLYEAASLDGAGAWTKFRTITLPLLRPVALSILLLGLIYTFKVFDLIYVMTGGGPVDVTTVLPIYTYQQTFEFFNFGVGAASSIVLLLGMLGIAVVYIWISQREEVQ
jgi:multiple sugar transport system permease protein